MEFAMTANTQSIRGERNLQVGCFARKGPSAEETSQPSTSEVGDVVISDLRSDLIGGVDGRAAFLRPKGQKLIYHRVSCENCCGNLHLRIRETPTSRFPH